MRSIDTVHKVRSVRSEFPYGQGYNTRIAIYVPSTEYDQDIPPSQMTERIRQTAKFLSDEFGGATMVTGTGSWYDSKRKRLIKERVIKVESFSPMGIFKKERDKVHGFLSKKVKKWKQNELAFEFESPKVSSNTFYRMNKEGMLIGS